MLKTILIILIILVLLGYGGALGTALHAILETIGSMKITTILVILLLVVLIKK